MITNVKKNKSTPIKIKGKRKKEDKYLGQHTIFPRLYITARTRDFFNGF